MLAVFTSENADFNFKIADFRKAGKENGKIMPILHFAWC